MADDAPPDPNTKIAEGRAELDRIDTQILALLAERVLWNEVIASAKAAAGITMPLRPAREVAMLRRLFAEAGPNVSEDLVFDVWRALIAANVQRQRPVEVVAFRGDDGVRLFDLARRHFSGSARIDRASDGVEALNRVAKGPSTVAVLPWPAPAGPGAWWARLNARDYRNLSIIAALPMRGHGEPEAAIVASGATLEPAGGDHTFALAFDPHHRATLALNTSGMKGREAQRVRETVLLEFAEFIDPADSRLLALARAGLEGLRVVGAYARV